MSERRERALRKTRIRATTKLTLFYSIRFRTFIARRSITILAAETSIRRINLQKTHGALNIIVRVFDRWMRKMKGIVFDTLVINVIRFNMLRKITVRRGEGLTRMAFGKLKDWAHGATLEMLEKVGKSSAAQEKNYKTSK